MKSLAMSPQPEVDVQKYIGPSLISQISRGKKGFVNGEVRSNRGNYGGEVAGSVCKCNGGRVHYIVPHNYPWTGVPLISVAGGRVKNKIRNCSSDHDSLVEYHKDFRVEEVLPIEKLAIHAQGAPLIVPAEGNRSKDSNRKFTNNGSNIYMGRNIFLPAGPDTLCCGSPSPPSCQEDALSLSGESDVKSESDHAVQSPHLCRVYDTVSTTSEDSGASENSLPRILKPRKRRKKERLNDINVAGISITLQPYKPLCYKYKEQHETNNSRLGQVAPDGDSRTAENGCDHHGSCRCREFHSSPFLTPPISPEGSPPKSGSVSPGCEVSARLVTAPGGMRDLEIKFLSVCPSENGESNNQGKLKDHKDSSVKLKQPFNATEPPLRPWLRLKSSVVDNHPSFTFSVMCYNILCDKYATRQQYGYCPNWALSWEYRSKHIMNEIKLYGADIITLQEVETEQYFSFFLPMLKEDGFDGIFSPKSRAKTMSENDKMHVDGCAIFFRANKFSLLKHQLVEFSQIAMNSGEGSDDMLNRVMTKDNIALIAVFETKDDFENDDSSSLHQMKQWPLLVCTAHTYWDPEFSDVKLIQTMMLMKEIEIAIQDTLYLYKSHYQTLDANSIPLVICGDFNSLPQSGVIKFLSTGCISKDHLDFQHRDYTDCLDRMGVLLKQNSYYHPFRIARAYEDGVMPYTNYTFDFKGIIDYIFYSKLHLTLLGLLGPIDPEWMKTNKVAGCPHPSIPSDHFSLLVEFQLKPHFLINDQVSNHQR